MMSIRIATITRMQKLIFVNLYISLYFLDPDIFSLPKGYLK